MSMSDRPKSQLTGRTIVPPLNGHNEQEQTVLQGNHPTLADFLRQTLRRSLQTQYRGVNPEETSEWATHAPLLDFFEQYLDNSAVQSVLGDNEGRNALVVLESGERFTINSGKMRLQPAKGPQPPMQGGMGQIRNTTAVPITKGDE